MRSPPGSAARFRRFGYRAGGNKDARQSRPGSITEPDAQLPAILDGFGKCRCNCSRDQANATGSRRCRRQHYPDGLCDSYRGVIVATECGCSRRRIAVGCCGIAFKPLAMILQIIAALDADSSVAGYLTKKELIEIVEPMSAYKHSVFDYRDTILAARSGQLNLAKWPNCAPAANDHRMAGEFFALPQSLWNLRASGDCGRGSVLPWRHFSKRCSCSQCDGPSRSANFGGRCSNCRHGCNRSYRAAQGNARNS